MEGEGSIPVCTGQGACLSQHVLGGGGLAWEECLARGGVCQWGGLPNGRTQHPPGPEADIPRDDH